jgi:Ca2+ transporting ATPase
VILDDEFNSVVTAIKWGRCVYDNIKKFVQFQLTINLVALAITLIGAFSDYKNPLKAIQLLWINLIMDTMASLAFGTEKPTNALLNRMPYTRNARLISYVMIKNILGHFFFQLGILMLLLFGSEAVFPGRVWEEKSIHHYTIIFNTFVWMQLFNEFNARKVNGEQNICEGVFTNLIFHAVLVISIGLQILMVEVFGPFVETSPLPWDEWLICIAFGALTLVWGVILRLIPVDEDWGRKGPPAGAFARDLPEWLERQGGYEEKKETSGLLRAET